MSITVRPSTFIALSNKKPVLQQKQSCGVNHASSVTPRFGGVFDDNLSFFRHSGPNLNFDKTSLQTFHNATSSVLNAIFGSEQTSPTENTQNNKESSQDHKQQARDLFEEFRLYFVDAFLQFAMGDHRFAERFNNILNRSNLANSQYHFTRLQQKSLNMFDSPQNSKADEKTLQLVPNWKYKLNSYKINPAVKTRLQDAMLRAQENLFGSVSTYAQIVGEEASLDLFSLFRGLLLSDAFGEAMINSLSQKMDMHILELTSKVFTNIFPLNPSTKIKYTKPEQKQLPAGVHYYPATINSDSTDKIPQVFEGFVVSLTNKARNGKLDPFIGRKEELDRIEQILLRLKKSNPLLLGEAGVGKTAIAEGLAQKIVKGEVPDKLKNCKIWRLDLPDVVAGTKYRGEMEEKMKNFLKYVEQQNNVILFIDEIHTIIKAGDSEGGTTIGNIIKPFLTDSASKVIGATTIDEYRKHFEKDKALDRRFQTIAIDPPSKEDMFEILKQIKPRYENHHGVSVSPSVLKDIINLSYRYIPNKNFPDKALDVLDDSSVLAKTNKFKNITKKHVEQVVSKISGVPLGHIGGNETERLKNLESVIHEKYVGQDDAVNAVCQAVRRHRAGINESKKPNSFMFVGPTGVGKTELAKALSRELTGSEDNLIRLDMNDFMEKNSVSRLIGSPPGYVGYDEGGQLTEAIRKRPYSVVLLDEIEKAHPDVRQSLLTLMDEGFIKDAQGRKIDTRNVIVIMTSNIGAVPSVVPLDSKETIGLKPFKLEQKCEDPENLRSMAIKNTFSPEFLNRLDGVIHFKDLIKDEKENIIRLHVKRLGEELKTNKGISLEVTPSAVDFLTKQLFPAKENSLERKGGRHAEAIVKKHLEDAIVEFLFNFSEKKPAKTIMADISSEGDKLTVKPVIKTAPV